jgi:transaldolase
MGSDLVFGAINADKDGKITPEKMGAGLGAAFHPAQV